ncbi:MAG: glycosyltransferase [Gaiellaceae bacterium]
MTAAGRSADSKLPVTAVVASRNEAAELARCLPTLAFCDEVIVIDVDSSDETPRTAEAHGARVVRHGFVPIAEWARISVVPAARHSWILLTDPDEEIPGALADEVATTLSSIPDDVAIVWAPIQFFFGCRALRGTVWGGENRRRFLVRREGVELGKTVFGGTQLREGFRSLELPFRPETAIRHHWVSGYRDWLGKHRRYLALDRNARRRAGEVTGLRAVAGRPARSFYDSFVVKKGYRDGLTGLGLSMLWALYSAASEIALLRELRRPRSWG